MSTSVALIDPKFPHNVGAAIRAASCFGTGSVYWTGDRVDPELMKEEGRRIPREERMKGYASTTYKHLRSIEGVRPIDFIQRGHSSSIRPVPVAIELVPSSETLPAFEHPENAIYVFGPEDGSLPKGIRTACHRFVTIPTFHCTNLAAAIYIVLYDRAVKRWQAGIEKLPDLDGEQRGWWHSPSIEGVQ